MGLSLSHLFLVLLIAFLVFGAGRLPTVMADLGKGLRAFKRGLSEEDENHPLLEEKEKPGNDP